MSSDEGFWPTFVSVELQLPLGCSGSRNIYVCIFNFMLHDVSYSTCLSPGRVKACISEE